MKNAPAQRSCKPILRPEPKGQNDRPHCLHGKASGKHQLLQPHHALDIVHAQGLGDHQPLLEADLPAQQKNQQCRHGHEAQSANLDQAQNHDLPETAPLAPGIVQHQSRHAGGGGGCKQRRSQPAGHPVPGRGGQSQQQRPQENDCSKHQCNHLGGIGMLGSVLHPENHQLSPQRHICAPFRQAHPAIIRFLYYSNFTFFCKSQFIPAAAK